MRMGNKIRRFTAEVAEGAEKEGSVGTGMNADKRGCERR